MSHNQGFQKLVFIVILQLEIQTSTQMWELLVISYVNGLCK